MSRARAVARMARLTGAALLLCVVGTAEAGGLQNGGFDAGLEGWTVEEHDGAASPGGVTVETGQAVFKEEGSFLVSLTQTFDIPKTATALRFDLIQTPGLDASATHVPDAFEAHLLLGGGAPLTTAWKTGATAYFNLQEGGKVNLGAGATMQGQTVSLDLQGKGGPGTTATLVLSLVGGDKDTASSVRIDNVVLDAVPNVPPIAVAGKDQIYACGTKQPIQLSGASSSDPDGQPITYSWSDGGEVVGTAAAILVTPPIGVTTYTLTVTDPWGETATDSVSVTLGIPGPGCPCSFNAISGDVNGDGGINVVDVQCTILTALWYLGGEVGAPPACLAGVPDIANLDCVDVVTVVDVSILVYLALGAPLSVTIDADGDGCPDTCYQPIE